ncbi:MAG: class I SAM-dependent methyltransferase [Ghiorsea sp.]
MRLTDMAQQWLTEVLEEGHAVVDATLGNGSDALFLATHIKKSGHLFGFDVQEQALTSSRKLLQDTPCKQDLFLSGHENMAQLIPASYHGKIKVFMFNLGWLPHSDKSVITKPQTTIAALEQSLDLLHPQGRISLMLYPGHEGGDNEAARVTQWLPQCEKKGFSYHIIGVPNRSNAPQLIQINR